MIRIDLPLLEAVSGRAKDSSRKRTNHNFHTDYSDPLQRMLNAIEPGSYIQPHKHENPDKREVFLIFTGRAVVIEYDEYGNITDHILLDPAEGNFGVEIPPRTYHSVIALDSGTVTMEVKDGPYTPIDDKNFATWAPREGDPETSAYLGKLINLLSLQKEQ